MAPIRSAVGPTLVACITIVVLVLQAVFAQQAPIQFGGVYAGLDARRQQLIDNWAGRFVKATGKQIDAASLYDNVLSLSTKTTFEAVTHALITTSLVDGSGTNLGDALGLVERLETVKGEVEGVSADRQFRIYVGLVGGAIDVLNRSQQFKRTGDNSVYHKGYPVNYRAQGGIPSIQISIAVDGRHADIDVDYRSSSFPIALLNGHLASSNSDVRAGANFDRHVNRWTGFQNWWNSFFGVKQERPQDPSESRGALSFPSTPRAGKAPIEIMVNDFLKAWLVEGDASAAMGYLSERSYACLARESDDPSNFDRGLAPYQLFTSLKSTHDALGQHASLEGLVVGTRLAKPGLRVVTQPHHAQFVVYAVPDDIAAWFDCESQMTLADPKKVKRAYGNYFGATFYVAGRTDTPVALLWARNKGFWKIVSWRVGADDAATPPPEAVPETTVVRISADPSLATSARGFLESWLLRKDYDAAFSYLSPNCYQCYNLERGDANPAATSPEDAGRKLRASLESVGAATGTLRSLDEMLSGPDAIHPAMRMMNHSSRGVFTLVSIPNALADALECAARARGDGPSREIPSEYGQGFGLMTRFKTRSGEAAVLRLIWRRENAAWRITSYGVELP